MDEQQTMPMDSERSEPVGSGTTIVIEETKNAGIVQESNWEGYSMEILSVWFDP